MRFFIASPDATGYIDPPIAATFNWLLCVDRWQDADCVVVLVSRTDRYRFNEGLRGILEKKPYVIVDMSEWFWTWDQEQSFIWGRNIFDHPWWTQNDDWRKLDQLFRDIPPKMQWVRELLAKDVSPTIQPMEWLVNEPVMNPAMKDEFYGRPLEIFMTWGRSHEMRVQMHAALWSSMSYYGWDCVGNFDHLEDFRKRDMKIVAAIHTPDFKRTQSSTVMHWQRHSKTSFSGSGCGVKCVRHAEACTNSIMILPHDRLAWTYPWDESNSLRVDLGIGTDCVKDRDMAFKAVGEIYEFLMRDDLDTIYAAGLETARKLRPSHFFPHHWIPTIAAKL